MNANEKKILKLLKEGKSQSAIANEVGVPRSTVQRISDKELGVDPASLKSLSTEQIQEIQKRNKAGESNTHLASFYDVSAKTIARALMVRIVEEANNVTVISPIKEVDGDGKISSELEVLEGSTAHDCDGVEWYVGHFLENHGHFLCLKYDGVNREEDDDDQPVPEGTACTQLIVAKLFSRESLTPIAKSGESYRGADISSLAELSTALVEGYQNVADGVVIMVEAEGDYHQMRGALDARRRVGFFDAILGRTLRLALSSVRFEIRTTEVEDMPEKQTKAEFGDKGLDVFLNEHQIMILPESVVIVLDGKAETITTSHQSYDRIVQAIKDRDIKLAYTLMKPREAIRQFANGLVDVSDNKVKWSGHDITGTSVAKRVIALMLKGDYPNLERLTRFLDKMFQNPSAALVQSGRIYEFMAYSDIEIHDDGDIILYKSVRGDYFDKHSGTINNAPGTIVRMARSFVNDNNKDLCSYGLHVCSLAYLKKCFGHLGQRVVRCKLNPKDIVSITDDYGSSKIRCCEYYVMDDYTTQYNRQQKSIDVTGLYK